MESNKYIEKWLNNSLSEEDRHVFENSKDYQSLIRLDRAVEKYKAPEFDIESELIKLNGVKNKKAKVIKVNWFQPIIRVAAVLVMVILAYLLYFSPSVTTIKSGLAQKTEVILPDASVVQLNASSSISYIEDEWQKNRQLKLKGEAYFKVAKGTSFKVNTSSGIVTVLGTQFNVKTRNNYFEVTCYEGLVAVESGDTNLKLPPGNMFRIINGEISKTSNLIDTKPSWLLGESSFTSLPFGQVLREFERQYDVVITTNNVDLDQNFTGRFANNNISLALKSISLPFNLSYENKEDQKHIILSGRSE